MSTKTITMTCRDETGGTVQITQHFDRDCSWMALAYQYYTFLAAMGYRLDTEDVGADVEGFISATENINLD